MKKVIQFSRLFPWMGLFSTILVISGITGFFVKGINFGIDFQAGFIQKVRFAPTAFSMMYTGEKNVQIAQNARGIEFTLMSVGSENTIMAFPYTEYPDIAVFSEAVQKIDGMTVTMNADPQLPLKDTFIATETSRLTKEAFRVHYIPANIPYITADEVRHALSSVPSVSVQQVGTLRERTFQIRLPDNGSYKDANAELRTLINTTLLNTYDAANFMVLSTDFVGSRFSGTLGRQAVLLVFGALVLIYMYALIRFGWNFAFGAVLALIHDVCVMGAFIVWVQMEFNSTTIAAILTIVGYSINDTVVVFDRIRENIRLYPKQLVIDVLDIAQTEVLGRTLITTLTTLLAALSLCMFTDGSMKDFALALIVGMISGVYSTVYIAGACIAFSSKNKTAGVLLSRAKKQTVSGITI